MNQELKNSRNSQNLSINNKSVKMRPVRSYGRIKSRKLSNYKKDLLSQFLPSLLIKDIDNLEEQIELHNINNPGAKNIIEIGAGFGDFIVAKAKKQSKNFFLAVEPHLNGVVSLLSKISEDSILNLRISNQDVRELLLTLKKPLFNEIYLLFPDPWPKKKHHKRRLINCQFLDFLANIAQKDALLTIATDEDNYKAIITTSILENNNWHWHLESKSSWQVFPEDWTETKYQKKAQAEGRTSIIFRLSKIN